MLVTHRLVIWKVETKSSVLIELVIMNCLQCGSIKKYGTYAINNGHLLKELGTESQNDRGWKGPLWVI